MNLCLYISFTHILGIYCKAFNAIFGFYFNLKETFRSNLNLPYECMTIITLNLQETYASISLHYPNSYDVYSMQQN